jgi:tetratricopeptide (TPR) repeat protein
MNRRLRKSILMAASGLFVVGLAITSALAAGGGGGGRSGGGGGSAGGGNAGGNGGSNGGQLTISNDASAEAEYAQAQTSITQADYQSAIGHLNKVLVSQPDNPDVLNLMGFSKRKMGDQTGALEYYNKALDLQPDHIGANEYLGELYLEMKIPAKAQERLDVLQRVCGNCEEFTELKEKIEKFKATQS